MIQRLSSNFDIHIPYKTIFKSQKYLLKRLYESISTGHNYIGQCKLSSRITIILLSFLFALMEQPNKNKVYYICQTKARCKEVKELSQKLRQYFKKHQLIHPLSQKTSSIQIEKEFNLQKSEVVILQSFFHKQSNLLKDYPNDKYLSIISIKQYFSELIQQKIYKASGSGALSHSHLHNYSAIKADYMLIQTVAYDQIIQTSISGWINEVIIRRAYIQYKKLYSYYHSRDDKKKLILKQQTNLIKDTHSQAFKSTQNLKRRSSNSSIEKQHQNNSANKQKMSMIQPHSIFGHHNHLKQQKQWNISQIQKRLTQHYVHKKQQLLKKNQKKNVNEQQTDKNDFSKKKQYSFEEQAIIVLGIVGYLINYFQNQQILTRQSSKTGKQQLTSQQFSSSKFIQQMEKKSLLKSQKIKGIYYILKKLVQTYPPLIKPEQYSQNDRLFRKGRSLQPYILSSKHILHLAKFCKDIIQLNQTFNQKYNEAIQVSKSCYKQKDKPSFFEIKYKCLNQPLLTQMILQFNQNFIVLMNNGISFDFYSTVFKPKILMKNQGDTTSIMEEEIFQNNQKSFKFCFDSPTNVADHIYNNIYGLNVTITPSQQNLKIPQFISKEEDEHDSLIVKAYGVLLFDLCEVVSDGIVVYFPSTSIIQKFKREWIEKQDIFKKINQVKRIFQETQFEEQNYTNLQQYKKVCDIGRGAVYLVAANGGMAKYTSFFGHYSRCVLFMGIPKNIQSRRKQHMTQKQKEQKKKKQINYFNVKQAQLQTFYSLKTTAKCLSNCINSNIEPKSVIFADVSYNKQSSKKWFPFIQEGSLNTSEVVDKLKKFFQHSQKLLQEGLHWQTGKRIYGGTILNKSQNYNNRIK